MCHNGDVINIFRMKKPAKKTKVNKKGSVIGAIAAGVVGVVAGAAAIFLSDKGNREAVKKTVNKTVKKGKTELAKAEKTVLATKKKITKK